MYKLKFLFQTCPEFGAIFMTDLQPLYLELLYMELYFLLLFGDCGNFLIDQKSAELVLEKVP